MSSLPVNKLPPEILDDAINWSLKITFNTPDAATHRAFEQWLTADPLHLSAWQRLQSLNARFSGLPAKAALATLNKLPEARLQRRQLLKLIVLATGAGTLGLHAERYAPWQRLVADYSTRTGEHRRWTLADGSVLDLNTDSAASLTMGNQRQVTLLRGEVALTTGRSHGAFPLRLKTPHCQVDAVDARFEARLVEDFTCLTVSQGSVALAAGHGISPFIIKAGEQWQIGNSQAQRLPAPEAEHGAWRDGMLIVRSLPLSQVLAQLARYRIGYLGWDRQIADLPVSGNFSTVRPEQSVALIAKAYGLQKRQLTRYWLRVSAA